ncbi:MAG: PHP domain-containing protein [Dehalococcoidia bacterium]|nr:PHP domain-containing protein [Dehalococcoidia bacterium]
MNGKIDLHAHTNASDGKYSPAQLVRLAASNALTLLSITDHDTVGGVLAAQTAAQEYPSLKIIPGVEISSHAPGNEVHILGFFIDIDSPVLMRQLAALSDSRRDRAHAIVEKLHDLGLDISLERVYQLAGEGSIGRPHIAQALMEKGYVSSFQEVFVRYLGQGCPAYVERVKITPDEAVELVLRSGGLPVLAHPTTISDAETLIIRLTERGLVGMECHYKDYTPAQRNELAAMARRHNLISTGGSDYHGIDETTEVMLGEASVPAECAENLILAARERGIKLPSYMD